MSNFMISGFYDEVDESLVSQLKLIRELGEKYLCPRSINGKSIADFTLEEFKAEVKPLLEEYEVEISTIGSPYGKIALDDDQAFKEQLVKLEETVKICQLVGCKYIRIFSFFVSPDINYKKAHKKVVSKLKQMLKVVEGKDVMLLHENEKEIYGDEPNRCVALYKDINHPQFRLCYDPSNYTQCGYDTCEAYELTKEYTEEYHIKDCYETKIEVPLGLGKANYQDILQDLIKSNYNGFLTLEPHLAKYAKVKIAMYVFPFMSFAFKGWMKTFKYIDKSLGISPFTKITTKEVFVLQYKNLRKMLDNLNSGANNG